MARERNTDRKERIPFGVPRKKMNLDEATQTRLDKAGKVPRWINDVGTRVVNALEGGYEFVLDAVEPVKTGDAKEVQEQDRKIRKQVGSQKNGEPLFAYLMAIPKRFHREDQAAKEAVNAKVDEAIRAGQPTGLKPHGVSKSQGETYLKGVDYKP